MMGSKLSHSICNKRERRVISFQKKMVAESEERKKARESKKLSKAIQAEKLKRGPSRRNMTLNLSKNGGKCGRIAGLLMVARTRSLLILETETGMEMVPFL
jgi:hypothetical protein